MAEKYLTIKRMRNAYFNAKNQIVAIVKYEYQDKSRNKLITKNIRGRWCEVELVKVVSSYK